MIRLRIESLTLGREVVGRMEGYANSGGLLRKKPHPQSQMLVGGGREEGRGGGGGVRAKGDGCKWMRKRRERRERKRE